MTGVMAAALVLVFVNSAALVYTATALIVLFLSLNLRQFSIGTWVPVLLSVVALLMSLPRGLPAELYLQACSRMVFLAALMAVLNTLRTAAARAPEVARAGQFLVGQPASRRYIALTLGGHLFGVLINFGGLALLLDLATRSLKQRTDVSLPPEIQEVRLRRMTLAIMRGFGLISLWSPLGFAANVVLITLPDLTYGQFGPLGLAVSFVFVAIGWGLDRVAGWRYRQLGLPAPHPPRGAWIGAVMLVAHVVVLGGSVVVLHDHSTLGFQQALIVLVPVYAALWTVWGVMRSAGPVAAGLGGALRETWTRQSGTAAEVGIFAAAGFLPVILLALLPMDVLQEAVAALGLGAVPLALMISLSVIAGAFLGVNPIVIASVMGAIALEMDVPGLSQTAIALGIIGGWSTAIGLSPFMTTLVFCSAIVARPAWKIGPVWNGLYCLTIFAVWSVLLVTLMMTGAV